MKLWEPAKFCCSCDLKTGCIALAILYLVGSSFAILSGVQTLVQGLDSTIASICNAAPDQEHCVNFLKEFGYLDKHKVVKMASTSIAFDCFIIIFACFLLYGISKKKSTFFIPLMTIQVIKTSAMILVSVGAAIFCISVEIQPAVIIFIEVILALIIFLQTYFLLVFRAYYLQIKREEANIHPLLNDPNL